MSKFGNEAEKKYVYGIYVDSKDNTGWKVKAIFIRGGEVWLDIFERKKSSANNADIFPIEVDSKIEFHEVNKGAETSITADKKKKTFLFNENYAVPRGFTIGIILPQNYIPISLSFGEKTMIPTGNRVKAGSPGYFDILYNNIEKTVVIIFNIYENTYFQFSCLGILADEDYKWRTSCFKSDVDAVVKINASDNTSITLDDVIKVQKHFKDDTNLEEVLRLLNELIEITNEINVENDNCREAQIKKKIGESLNTNLSLMSSIASLTDSYINGGIVGKVISSLLMMVQMYVR